MASLFTRLGFTAFGGPAAHVALIEREVVERRGWIDRQHFLDLVAAVNFIPGPNSTELVIHLGLLRAGIPGLFVAGMCFILPAMLIILPIAYFYVHGGGIPQVASVMHGIGAVMIAVIAAAMVGFARTALRGVFFILLAIASLAGAWAIEHWLQLSPELIVLAAAALAGATHAGWRPKTGGMMLSVVPLLGTATTAPAAFAGNLTAMTLFFLRVGATLFGSGYVLVSYLQGGLVDQRGWLTQQELLDGISVGQVTPGPLLTSASFLGYVMGFRTFGGGDAGGLAGAVLATAAIFAPAFGLLLVFSRALDRIRRMPAARGALDGMNAAVVALLVLTTIQLARGTLTSALAWGLAIVGAAVLMIWRINATWLIAAGALAGLILL